MKAVVTKRFRDIYNNGKFEVGEVFEGKSERVKDLQDKGYLGEVVQEKKKSTRKTDGEGE